MIEIAFLHSVAVAGMPKDFISLNFGRGGEFFGLFWAAIICNGLCQPRYDCKDVTPEHMKNASEKGPGEFPSSLLCSHLKMDTQLTQLLN